MVKSNRRKHVAVLGAGILGSCIALLLARKGISVELFDLEAAPMSGASRWNEGKIHLGYLYGADSSLKTAKALIPAGLAFAPLMRDLIEQSMAAYVTRSDDVFLIHRDSIIQADQARHYYHQVSELIRDCAEARHYLVDVLNASVKPIPGNELDAIANPDLVQAGFLIPERSIQTNWIADQLCAALAAQPNIRQNMNTMVTAVEPVDAVAGPWRVITQDNAASFDVVVNALWHGRIDIDRCAGVPLPVEWSNRYRLSLFVRTRKACDLPSAVLAVGPYGDIKNYNGRDFYLSWYPAGLVYESDNSSPDMSFAAKPSHREHIVTAIRAGLASAFHGVEELLRDAEDIRLAGGYVFAQGRGSLARATSTIHRRDRFGVVRQGQYYSVDTGKYSIAPWLANSVAQEIAGH